MQGQGEGGVGPRTGAASRRQVLALAAPSRPPAPRGDLVSVPEYEAQARQALGAAAAPLLGGDRSVTDRITLHPRMNIPTRDLDLTCPLFGDDHFAPIVLGPVADQRRFHPEGELATVRGASAAHAAMVVSSRSAVPLAELAAAAASPLWLQVEPGDPRRDAVLAEAAAARVRALVVTLGASPDWRGLEAVVRATPLPVIVKGVASPQQARAAVARGAAGLVVSGYRPGQTAEPPAPLLHIRPVVEAVGVQVPVLADGGFRRGTDILKALAFGARAVVVARPAMWGLAAYGADGVQGVTQTLQTELARYMTMCGCPTLEAIHPGLVRVHAAREPGRQAAREVARG
jgi:4-hydroxymandelate oxidase